MDRDISREADSVESFEHPHVPNSADFTEGLEPSRQLLPGRDFIGFYGRSWLVLHSYARRLVSDPFEAEEIVQDAFLKLFIAMPELENEGHALAFMRTTIRNLCIDRYRRTSRRPAHAPLGEEHHVIESDDSHVDPVVAAEDAVIIREALSKLKWEHREALIAWEIEGASTADIAQRIGVDEKNVKHTLNRARAALRKILVGSAVDPSVDLSIPEQMSVAVERAKPVVLRGGALMLVTILAWRGLSPPGDGLNIGLSQINETTQRAQTQTRDEARPAPSASRTAAEAVTPVPTSVPLVHPSSHTSQTIRQAAPTSTVEAQPPRNEVGGSIRALARPRLSATTVDRRPGEAIASDLQWTYSVSTDSGVIVLNQRVSYNAEGLELYVDPVLQVDGSLVRASVSAQDVSVTFESRNVVLDANIVLSRSQQPLVTAPVDAGSNRSFATPPGAIFLHIVLSNRLDKVISQSLDV